MFAYINHARICSGNHPVLSDEHKVFCSKKQWKPLVGLELTTDRYQQITPWCCLHTRVPYTTSYVYIDTAERSRFKRHWSLVVPFTWLNNLRTGFVTYFPWNLRHDSFPFVIKLFFVGHLLLQILMKLKQACILYFSFLGGWGGGGSVFQHFYICVR